MKRIDPIPSPKKIIYSESFVPFTPSGAVTYGECGEVLDTALSMLNTCISKNGNILIYCGKSCFTSLLNEKTRGFFSEEKNAKRQGYYLDFDGILVRVAAYTQVGCAYALMTLLQLFDKGELPESFEIFDSPDFLYRANKWLSWCECGIWSYDRGDGIEKYKERIIKKLDLSFKYKINTVIFEAFGWASERFPGYNDLMRYLNREARKRGIHLLNNGYGMGYGLIGHGKGVYQGACHMNRKSYPDGDIYPCIGSYEFGHNEDDVKGREYGTCLSNDALLEEKLTEIVSFLENTEMGALYIHNMDADYILEPLWKARCPECKKRWPSDSLYDKDGCAGAFAYFIENLYKGICRAKTDKYDAERDCIVYIISPGYMYMHQDEEYFDGATKFWQNVARLLPYHENLYIGFREHYQDHNTGEMRLEKLKEGFSERNIGVFDFCGGDGFYSDKLFVPGGLFLRLMKDADAMLIENGNANQEPTQLYNAEYLWNSEKSAFYNIPDMPTDYRDFEPFYIDYLKTVTRPAEIYGEGGLLEVICEKLYGKAAAKDFKSLYSISGKDGSPPLTSACSCEIFTNFTKVVYPMRWDYEEMRLEGDGKYTVEKLLSKFVEVNFATKEAAILTEKISREGKYLPECHEDVLWMKDNFALMSRYTALLVRYMQCYKTVLSHFELGGDIHESVKTELISIKESADVLLNEANSSPLKAICPLGGATVRRDDLADFISYNSEIMLRSIEENKRIPSGLRPLRTRDHW